MKQKENNSLYGPYSIAMNTVTHRDAKVTTIFNTKKFDNILENLDTT